MPPPAQVITRKQQQESQRCKQAEGIARQAEECDLPVNGARGGGVVIPLHHQIPAAEFIVPAVVEGQQDTAVLQLCQCHIPHIVSTNEIARYHELGPGGKLRLEGVQLCFPMLRQRGSVSVLCLQIEITDELFLPFLAGPEYENDAALLRVSVAVPYLGL